MKIVRKVDTEAAPADLLDRVRARGMWPSSAARWCTSDYKRGPARRYFTELARQWRTENPAADRPCRILSTRLSCSFCVLATKKDLVTAARLRPELAAEYAAVEVETGHLFRQDVSMASVCEAAGVTVSIG